MTYGAKDKSVAAGSPVELYEFVSPLGTYRYTSDTVAHTVGADEYEPIQITRTAIEITSIVTSQQTMDFTVPSNSDLAIGFGRLNTPTELSVTVKRVHRGDDWTTEFKIEWQGQGIAVSNAGKLCTIKTGSKIQQALVGNVGSIYWQRPCNHDLYDARCKVDPASFTVTASVVLNDGVDIVVDDDGFTDNALKGGTIINDRTGEKRIILGNVSNTITIGYAFIDCVPTDSVSLIRGCDHAIGTCLSVFNNVENYGGFPYIPTVNPFEDGV